MDAVSQAQITWLFIRYLNLLKLVRAQRKSDTLQELMRVSMMKMIISRTNRYTDNSKDYFTRRMER
jgi:hypothetical protein